MPIQIKGGQITGTISQRAGWETAPLGAAFPIDLTADGNSIGFDAPLEYGTSGVVFFGVFEAVLTALQVEPLVKAGVITRREQVKAMWDAAGEGVKNNWAKIAGVTIVCSLLPGLAPVVGLASIFSGVFLANKLVRAFWASLSVEQQSQLTDAARTAGVELPDEMKPNDGGITDATLDPGDEPLPSFS